jgi:hypothetical protein
MTMFTNAAACAASNTVNNQVSNTYNASQCLSAVSDGSGKNIYGSSYRVSLITNGHPIGSSNAGKQKKLR